MQKFQLLEEILKAQEQIRLLSRRLVDAQENERRDSARELHDEIGSLLTALKLAVSASAGVATAQAQRIIDEAITKTRAMAQYLRPPCSTGWDSSSLSPYTPPGLAHERRSPSICA